MECFIKLKSVIWTLFFGGVVFLNSVHAADVTLGFEDSFFPEIVTSARANGMSGAFVGLVDDNHSPFYNPAGLGTIRKGSFHFFNLAGENNQNLLEENSVGDSNDLEAIRQFAVANNNKLYYGRIQSSYNLTFRHLSLGFFYSRQTKGFLGDEDTDQFEFADRYDFGPYLALNMSLGGGIFKIGVMGAWLTRFELIDDRVSTNLLDIKASEYNQGQMILLTPGAKLTLPIAWLPTFSATMHNSLGRNFNKKSGGAGIPHKFRQVVNAGFSFTPITGKFTRVHFEWNFKDTQNKYKQLDSSKRNAYGLEIDFLRHVYFRAGFGGGGGSGGLGFRFKYLQFDLETHAIDTKTDEFPDGKVDRRYGVYLALGF